MLSLIMASKHVDEQTSSTNEDIPLRNIEYCEDEYGYVDPRKKRISKEVLDQLPSRKIDLVDREISKQEMSDVTLRRRYSKYRTLQLKSCSLSSYTSIEDDASVTDKLYDLLNSDPAATEEEKLKTLRELHHSLTIKRKVKERLDSDIRRRRGSQALNRLTRLKLRTNQVWHKFLFGIKTKLYSLEPWHNPIKAIQGQFGSAVASYFIFLRWLLYINLVNFFISLFFIITPQLTYQLSEAYNESETGFNYTSDELAFSDFITGSGWLSNSLMYFGHYTHRIIEVIPGLSYNMPLAYLLTVGINSIINLIAVSYSLTSAYQKNYIDMSGDIKHIFCNKIFSAWDYSIETDDAANLRKMAFCNEIKELLAFAKKEYTEKKLFQKVKQAFFMVFFNLLSLGIAAGAGGLIYYLISNKILEGGVLDEMTLSLIVTCVSTLCYFFLKYFTRWESYLQRKSKLYLTMIRVVILRTAMLGVIVYFWMVVDNSAKKLHECFETELGEEIYRLILVNFLVTIIFITIFGDILRKMINIYVSAVNLNEFDVAFNTLDLIYIQTLAWMGSFCMPVVPLVMIIILISLFYTKLSTVVSCCRPPKRTLSVNEAQTFFLILIFFMFILTAFTVGYVLFALKPSTCGPFKEYDHTSDVIHKIIFNQKEKHQSSELVKYISSPGVMFAFFCAFCVVVYFMRAQAKAYISVEKKVREQLVMEGKDKVFLLKLFDVAIATNAQMEAKKKNGNKDMPPPGTPSSEVNKKVVINERFNDYYNLPPHSPMPQNLDPGYSPASAPVNKQASVKLRSPLNAENGRDSPARKPKGINIPTHQPGFRYFRDEDSPRTKIVL